MTTATIQGHAYSDNSAPGTRNLDNDGHRTWFLPLVSDIVQTAADTAASAAAAAASATAAAGSATAADTSADNADTYAQAALAYRNTASTHATNAGNSSTAAAASAASASGYATAAQGYRDTASTHATTATTQATAAAGSATAAAGSATSASNSAAAAAASAVTAVNAPGTAATSTTSLTVGTGAKSLTIQTGKAFVVGMSVKIAITASPGNWMAGDVTAYNSGTGALDVNSVLINGSGTASAWTVSLTAPVSESSGGATTGANTFTDDQTILASGGNGFLINTVAASSTPELSALGADTNVGLSYATKGTGSHGFRTAATALQLNVSHTASAVDYVNITGAAAAGTPDISVLGSDANIGLNFSSKGTGGFAFRTNTNVSQFEVAHTASAANKWQVTGAAAAAAPDFLATGSDTNVSATLSLKGTGTWTLRTNTNVAQFEVAHTGSAVNRLRATGAATGSAPVMSAQGSDTNIGLGLATKGTGAASVYTNGTTEQLRIGHTASAVNYLLLTGSVTTAALDIAANGSDTNIGVSVSTKGTGAFSVRTAGNVEQFRVANVASAVNYLQASGAATTAAPGLSAQGSDTNIGITFSAKGTGGIAFRTAGTVTQFEITNTASAVNYLRATGSATGNGVVLSAQGSDTNIDAAFMAKGTGGIGLNVSDPLSNVIDADGAVVGNITAMAADAMDLSLGDFFTKTINGAWSPTFSNVPSSRRVHWELVLTHTSGAITWPASVKWPDNTAPTLTTGKTHKFFFQTHDGGTTVRASCLKNFTG